MSRFRVALVSICFVATPTAANETLHPDPCAGNELRVQVLGSGGADLASGRAASAYLIWIDGKARVLVDAGAGSALRFAESGARVSDIDAILFTQLRVDRTLDFPALIAAAIREGRMRVLPLYGPIGNRLAPSTVTFVRALLDGTRGAYRQLSRVLSPLAQDSFKLEPHDLRTRTLGVGMRRDAKDIVAVSVGKRFRAAATYLTVEGPPMLAWRIRTGGRSVVIAGDITGDGNHLEQLAHAADLLIVDHATTPGAARASPGMIGRLAVQTQVKRLLMSQRTRETLGKEDAALAEIRRHYAGPVAFADDLDCFALP